jgi:hypothetical protein
MKNKRTVKARILDISIYPDNSGRIITVSTKENPKGHWILSAKQLDRMKKDQGERINSTFKRRAVGGSLVFDAYDVEAGDTWTNKKTGETGVYSKDHSRVENQRVEYSDAALRRMDIAAAIAELEYAETHSESAVEYAAEIKAEETKSEVLTPNEEFDSEGSEFETETPAEEEETAEAPPKKLLLKSKLK